MLTVGVHIEDYGLWAVLLKTGKQGRVESGDRCFFPLSLEDLDEEQKKLRLASKIKELAEKYPPKHHHFVFSIPQRFITVHDLSFPFKEKFRISRTLPFEISNRLPLSLDEVAYSSKIAFQNKNSSQVLVFIADKKWIRSFIKFLSESGIEPFILTPKSSALINLFEDITKTAPLLQEKVLADELKIFLSYRRSMALILSKQRVIGAYDLDWGIESCVKDISEKYIRPMDQALDYFRQNAFLIKEESEQLSHLAPLSKIMKKSFSSLSQKLRLLKIHLQGMGHSSIKNIEIFGPGADIQNLTYHLQMLFKIPVQKMEKLSPFPTLPLEFLPALGAALEGLKRPKNPPVNFLLKSKSNEMIQISQKRRKTLAKAAFILGLFVSYTLVRDWRSSHLEEEISRSFSSQARKTAKLTTRNISVKNVKKFLKEKENLKEKDRLFTNMGRIMPSVFDQLNWVTQSIEDPDGWGLELLEMDISESNMTLSGFINPDHFNQLKDNLKSKAKGSRIQDQSNKKNPKKQTVPPAPPPEAGGGEPKTEGKEPVFFHFTFKMRA